ncbi:SET domain-containing protein [Aaosphaeria arxii CBS 175.79]|uniref:SET domain-containing protein n=1 Tax=Aaosphaeria arxii CBS 175.79 TaxID=1450172 RepID=A0A6A5XCK4_9PLEO|nr:SET domain-containing protein [Aaosphaeria arxii CBS 175.79]KAF2010835.1 SET domain-containing protein [Aaosphaeria arxii CBS 175.79]
MGTTSSLPMYSVEDVPGKGKGLIALKDIPVGARIVSETPFLTSGLGVANLEQLQIQVYQQVSSLSESQQQAFLSLHNIYPYISSAAKYRGIFRTNALPIGPSLQLGGVFLIACRINHACDNNAQNYWNDNLNQLTIHAVKDIPKGEEITISYLSSRRGRRWRQEELRNQFKFTCSCALCSLAPVQSRESDSKLNRVHELDCIIEQGGVQGLVSSAQRMLNYVDEQVQLWNEPTLDIIGLTRAYPDAFEIAIANGDLARARIFAERCLSLYRITGGDDSPEVPQYSELVQDPTRHLYFGMSMKWKTTLDEVPQGLGTEEFEDWLWKRKVEST